MVRSILLLALLLPAGAVQAGGPYAPLGTHDIPVLDRDNGATGDTVRVHRENTRLVASGLAVLLGPFGAHRLYLGTRPGVAVAYGLTFGGFGTLVLLDLGHLLFTKDLGPFRDNPRILMWSGKGRTTPP